MTAKGDYTTRAKVLALLRNCPDKWLTASQLSQLVYAGRDDGYSRQSIKALIRLLRKEHGESRIQTRVVYAPTLGKLMGYYRWKEDVHA